MRDTFAYEENGMQIDMHAGSTGAGPCAVVSSPYYTLMTGGAGGGRFGVSSEPL